METAPATSPARPRRRSRHLPWLAAAVLLALIVAGLWPAALPVELAPAARGPLTVTVNEVGMTRVKNRYVISSPVAGHLRRIAWKAGAPVIAGQTVLAVLETNAADFLDARSLAQAEARTQAMQAAREQAAAQLARATAAARLAHTDFTRAQRLFAQRSLSQQELDTATLHDTTAAADQRAAEFGLKVADYELAQARAVLDRGQPATDPASSPPPLVLTSPVNGRVLRVLQESERVVPAGLPLLEVGDPTDLEARIEVLSRDGVAIQPGAQVALDRWGGAAPLNGRVRLVEPSAFTKISALGVEEQRVYVIVDFTDPVEKRATLGDAYRVEARIVTWSGTDVLRVPSGALFQRGTAWQTFVADGHRARLRAITPGHSNGLETEILSGLKAGEKVIVYPGDKIADGVRITELQVAP
ncbi:HlyD family efflux transporter periplasmic adaptor subunit [Horticoccus luteus]|uniref:HlyD family efflux transporter periplasmic adaptor subunit n=1 Tax=Horticoccus luteus TaxID=2862869 RepID=A0A8F9TVT3_9BACT|nr:HlyD family efflux transporter periplasmic adaptor subunit [Horticoccus luteus]QYM78987.1 HlyD family efflux transporter periplasmic adaptor subunit [Horticoccus luteus]